MSANIGKVERVFRLIVGLPLFSSAITGFCPIRAALDRGRV